MLIYFGQSSALDKVGMGRLPEKFLLQTLFSYFSFMKKVKK